MDPVTAMTLSLGATALSTGMGVISSIQQGKAQSEQAKYQAEAAKENRQLEENAASAERRQGYDNMITRRQETAKIIGKQRAAAGASGAAVDAGSNLDLQLDTAQQGELDAINIYNQALDRAYNHELQADNYARQAGAFSAQSKSARNSGYMNAFGTALGGLASMGSTWAGFKAKFPDAPKNSGGVYNPAPLNNALAGKTKGSYWA